MDISLWGNGAQRANLKGLLAPRQKGLEPFYHDILFFHAHFSTAPFYVLVLCTVRMQIVVYSATELRSGIASSSFLLLLLCGATF
jgi:hypothetical protein